MNDLFQTAERGDRAAAHIRLAQLASGEPVTRQHLNRAMVQAFGGTDAEGRWTQRSSFEVLEHALALHLRGSLAPLASLADVAARIDLARSEEHTSEFQSLISISYAVYCLNRKKYTTTAHIKSKRP